MASFIFILECSSYLDGSPLGLMPFESPSSTILDSNLSLISKSWPGCQKSIFVIVTDKRFTHDYVDWAISRMIPAENVQCPMFTPPSNSSGSVLVYMKDNLVLPRDFNFLQFLSQSTNAPIVILDQELARRQQPHPHPILSTSDYESAASQRREIALSGISRLPSTVTESCCARIGLMGNPSDGFQGKTLSFLIDNFSANVTLEQHHTVEIVPHPVLDPNTFNGLDKLSLHTSVKGYYGGMRLVQASCHVFAQRCVLAGHTVHMNRGFKAQYDTTIPRMVGLSGSSAIIIATFRALMRFYGLTLEELKIAKDEFPTIILDIERKELCISAGLQDRVIQTYGGLVHMDFTPSESRSSRPLVGGVYTSVDPSLLPEMYLAYNVAVGGDSGSVHSTVKERWASRESGLVSGMRELGSYADEALSALKNGDRVGLAKIMRKNFGMRRQLYGDAVVGAKNIAMIDLADTLGLSCKFTGSGGALLCMRSDGSGFFDAEKEQSLRSVFAQHDFNFVRLQPAIPL